MEPKIYPRAFWNAQLEVNDDPDRGPLNPQYAGDKKQEDALVAKGFSDVYANAGNPQYPMRLYREDGSSTVALDAAHEKKLVKSGHDRKPVATPTHDVVLTAAADPFSRKRIEDLELKIAKLTQVLEAMTAAQE